MMRWFFILFCLTCLMACGGKPQTKSILLPEESGETGKIVVRSDTSGIMLDKPYTEAVYHASTGGFLTRKTDPGQVLDTYGKLLATEPAMPVMFTLHFLSGPADLTPESRSVIPRIIETAEKRASSGIDIIGHTDTMGTDEKNVQLSLARARRVADILVTHGVNPDRITIQGQGEKELMVSTPDNTPEPGNRRVEVMIR
jgi:outer membrane protein OmpA-like peptidoglycan-associated protein